MSHFIEDLSDHVKEDDHLDYEGADALIGDMRTGKAVQAVDIISVG